MDEHLSWKHNINNILNKISKSIYVINKVKHFLPQHILRTLYFSLVHSHIMYGIHAWGNADFVNKILLLQKRAVRIITNKSYRAHTDPLFKSCKILKIEHIYQLQSLLFMHDLQNNRLPLSFHNYANLNNRIRERTTRQDHLFHTERPRTNFSAKLPNQTFPRIWNVQPKNILQIENRKLFQKQCMESFLSHYQVTVRCNNRHCRDCQ